MGGAVESDEQLLARCQSGERSAFETLVDRYQRVVCGVCFSITGDWALAEDVAQETFVTAWRRLGTLREPGRVASWLCGIARNLSRKAGRGRTGWVDLETAGEPAHPAGTPLESVLTKETRIVVGRALAELPETYREPLVLFYQQGRSAQEVGAALNLSASAVHQRLSRGRRLLADELHELVEATLSHQRPRKGFTTAVLVTLGASRAASVQAAVATQGALMSTSTWVGAGTAATGLLIFLGWIAGRPASDTITPASSRDASRPVEEISRPVTHLPAASSPKPSLPRSTPLRERAPLASTESSPERPHGEDHYETEGLVENWAHGSLGALLGPCLKGEAATRTQRFELQPTDSEWRVEQLAGDPLERSALECLQNKLSAFGLDLAPDASSATLEHRFEATTAPEFQPDRLDLEALASGPTLGPADAPVTMVVFVAFKCMFCGRMLGTVDQLREDYEDSLRIVVRPFALLDSDIPITEAAYAAEAQGLFFAMHDEMLAAQDGLSAKTLRTYAERAGLDLDRFDRDMAQGTFRDRVLAEREEAKRGGIRGVPATLIGDDYLVGAQPIGVFRAKIDALLGR